jgi:hypothetical protein
MPCILQIDSGKRIIHSIYSGVVSFADAQCQRSAIAAWGDDIKADSLVIDFTNVQRLEITADQVYALAKTYTPLRRDAKHIFVAPRPDQYGIARMYQIIGQDYHPNTFVVRSREEANTLLQQCR